MTLVGEPQVIFLDEPTTGLDPQSRRVMWECIRELAGEGVTILLTTQYLDEADELAGRIAVLDQGRIVAEGTPDELKRQVPGGHVRLQFATTQALRMAAAVLDDTGSDDEKLVLRCRVTAASPHSDGCSNSSTMRESRSMSSPSRPLTSMTCSSP